MSSASRWLTSSKVKVAEDREEYEGSCSESGGDGERLGEISKTVEAAGVEVRDGAKSWSGRLLWVRRDFLPNLLDSRGMAGLLQVGRR